MLVIRNKKEDLEPVSVRAKSGMTTNAKRIGSPHERTIKVSFTEIIKLFERNKQKIWGIGPPDLIVGITTGGAVIAQIVSQLYRIPFITWHIYRARILEDPDLSTNPKCVLLIDDLADRGRTLFIAENKLRELIPNLHLITASIYPSKNIIKTPHFFIKVVDNVRFEIPWKNEHRLKKHLSVLSRMLDTASIIKSFKKILRLKRKKMNHPRFLRKIPFDHRTRRIIVSYKAKSPPINFGFIFRYTGSKNLSDIFTDPTEKHLFSFRVGNNLVYNNEDPERFTMEFRNKASNLREMLIILDHCTGREIRCRGCKHGKGKIKNLCSACSVYIRSLQLSHDILRNALATIKDVSYFLKIGDLYIPIQPSRVSKALLDLRGLTF